MAEQAVYLNGSVGKAYAIDSGWNRRYPCNCMGRFQERSMC